MSGERTTSSAAPAGRVGVPTLLLWLVWLFLVVAVPGLGVWTASSLAAYRGGPVWLVVLAGALLFPILPLAWEARSAAKRRRRANAPPRVLRFWDRLVLRTLALNLLFLAVLLAAFPGAAFAALATRGDWFLDGRSGPAAQELRSDLFRLANGLEWLHRAARKNPYEEDVEAARRAGGPRPTPAPPTVPSEPSPSGPDRVVGVVTDPSGAPPAARLAGTGWPPEEALHAAVVSLPAEAESSPAALARHVVERESDRRLRVKALHDWVADRVVYDVEALTGPRPPQDAETVFRSRRAVCAGYAELFSELLRLAGEEAVVVAGDSRHESGDLTGQGHAWNAVRVDGRWELVDVTWDAGYVKGPAFFRRYASHWLFTPPEIFGVTHFPDDARWQLRDAPLSRGEFFRQPILRPGFFVAGLALVSPTRSQVSAAGTVEVVVENPNGRSLLAHALRAETSRKTSSETPCRVDGASRAFVRCDLAGSGTYRVQLFAHEDPRARHPLVAEIEVVNRGG